MERSRRTPFPVRNPAAGLLVLLSFASLAPLSLDAQIMGGSVDRGAIPPPYQQQPALPPSTIDHLQGVVVSSLDGKPVPRVLVTTLGNQGLAVLTDYEGRFSFDLRRPLPQASQPGQPPSQYPTIDTTTLAFSLRKPGYTNTTETATVPRFTPSGPEPEIRLRITPAGLIAGTITAPSGHLPPFLSVQLRRGQINEGSAYFAPISSAQISAAGEYRFPELPPGDYKITTLGSPDYTSTLRRPRTAPLDSQPDSLPGLLPAAYPDASSLDDAAPIHLSPSQAVVANLTLHPAPFYRVVIPISSPEAPNGVSASLTPEGPGLNLTYDSRSQTVHGFLPAGSYTVALRSVSRAPQPGRVQGQISRGQQNQSLTGTLILHVDGPVHTSPVALHPAFDIPVNIRRDFTADTAATSAQPASPVQFPVATVTLLPSQPGDPFINSASSIADGNGDLHIPNVSEGTYRVRVFPMQLAYVASIRCAGTDLLRDPLVVGPSGLSSPIEITLRNDSANLKVTLLDDSAPGASAPPPPTASQLAAVTIIPLDSPEQPAVFSVQTVQPSPLAPYYGSLGQFANLAPGRYLVLAVHTNGQPLVTLEYRNPKVLESLLSKGTIITLTPGQKAEARIPVLPPDPED